MRALLVAAALLIPLALAPTVDAWPPVCIEKSAGAFRTTVTVVANCGVSVSVSHCPPAGDGPCVLAQVLP